ncbi:transposase InsO family protein [Paenibacillus sp. PvR133]|uniref:DDE-type integrase/transposase/recombinase n=1 Tax=Paenibacillus sp. PvR133 TaxID=2806598 RepID=UPI001B728B31|nr:transposase InsO family protein [Paenibacillus sp. PvR133]
MAYEIGERNDNELVLRTFSKAFAKQKDVTGLIVHSDQGFQYTSRAYQDMLPMVGAQISMSRQGNCYDNASMESFFSHLKTEDSTLIISERLPKHKAKLRNIFVFITENGHNEN